MKSQVWTAVAAYVLVAIVRKRLGLDLSMHATLQVPSITPFEKVQINQLLTETDTANQEASDAKHLILL